MKKNYMLMMLFASFLFFNQVQAQVCPDNGFSNSTSLFFFYDAGAPPCVDRPTTITVAGSVFNLITCDSSSAVYDIEPGDTPIADITSFTADFGAATCEYINGNLTNETLSMESIDKALNNFTVFPNPVVQGNSLHVVFGSNLNAEINLFSVTGKRVLTNTVSNLARKQLEISNLPNGVYLLQVESGSSTVSKKVVIMK
ncbi:MULTISPECIES: T9SS type A sorting domain-containing protein [unclassified Bizionia]|uniref:T9SS type A sorting domain-containing protein n=1 Tax=unclassified Bizionia TaxID=2626393 RepID=UPI00204C583F|nr:T9SS type A sorting domain-containing protein [Bizionia sp. M204]UPS90559.1 T9SS type A sorting domain-containing protein [Bizionia sp. M204]